MKAVLQEIEDRELNLSDVNLDECAICNECSAVLLPDDECYNEFGTNDTLCTQCCFYDEYLSAYIRGTTEASHMKLRIELDVA